MGERLENYLKWLATKSQLIYPSPVTSISYVKSRDDLYEIVATIKSIKEKEKKDHE